MIVWRFKDKSEDKSTKKIEPNDKATHHLTLPNHIGHLQPYFDLMKEAIVNITVRDILAAV